MSAAFPPNHDDNGGGVVWRAAAGHRLWRGLGIAAALGYFHRRRPVGQPDADFVHHTRYLSLPRPVEPVVETPCRIKESLMKKRLAFAVLLSLAACAVGPDYDRPSVETPAAYKEGVNWIAAQPNDAIDRGAWWTIYNDPTLNDLEAQVNVSNQTLKADEAAYRQAVAVVAETNASLFPTLSLSAGSTTAG